MGKALTFICPVSTFQMVI